MDYQEFRKDAIEQYSLLPDETNELYKKYHTDIPLPSEEELISARASGAQREVEALSRAIEEKTGLKFDVIFSNSFVKNQSGFVKIRRMSELGELLDRKIYKNSENKLAAFINANSRDAIMIDIQKGAKEKLNMLFINDSHLFFECIFNLGEESKLDVFQVFSSTANGSVAAPLQEFSLEKGSHLEFALLNDGNDRSVLMHLSKGSVGEKAKLNANFVYNGSKTTKSVNFLDAKGLESEIEVTEIIYGTKEQRFDVNTHMLNSVEGSRTKLNTGAILDGSSLCQLKGYAKIEKYAKAAFSNINQRGIILNERAHMDALPDMSIDYSDQVSATHSAATSPIDKEALFYISSRGIDEASARKMFVASFISKYLSNIGNAHAKEIASSIMLSRIDGAEFGAIKDISPKGVWLTASK